MTKFAREDTLRQKNSDKPFTNKQKKGIPISGKVVSITPPTPT